MLHLSYLGKLLTEIIALRERTGSGPFGGRSRDQNSLLTTLTATVADHVLIESRSRQGNAR